VHRLFHSYVHRIKYAGMKLVSYMCIYAYSNEIRLYVLNVHNDPKYAHIRASTFNVNGPMQ